MRLGYKSLMLIDILITSGLDMLDFATFPSRALFRDDCRDADKLVKQQLKRMHGNGWIEWDDTNDADRWVAKVTAEGRSEATDDIDPQKAWRREWDERWRLIIFDIPTEARLARSDLDRWLRKRRFGHLQGSVWIRPWLPESWKGELGQLRIEPAKVTFFEGGQLAANSDADLVRNAWNFEELGRRYKAYLKFLSAKHDLDAADWLTKEGKLWREAFAIDPFLPDSLLPQGYLGKEAWRQRRQAYRQLVSVLRSKD